MSAGLAQLAAYLAETPFAVALGLQVVSAEAGRCTLLVPLRPEATRPGGIMAGYLLAAAADVAVWLAIKTVEGIEDPSVTVDLHTAFVAPARGDVRCEAWILRRGGQIVLACADCTDAGTGEIVSHHTATYARPRRPG